MFDQADAQAFDPGFQVLQAVARGARGAGRIARIVTGGGGGIGGGSTTTGGNLVFHVVNDGTFKAYSADKGEKLFEVKVGRTGMAPPITYEAGGKQYVAFMGGLGRAANIVGPNDEKVEGAPMLYVFALDGKAEMPKAVAPPPAQGQPAAAPAKPAATAPELVN